MLTDCGTLFNTPLLTLITCKYRTASVRGSPREEGREEWYPLFCRQGSWDRGKITTQPVNDKSRHKPGLLRILAPVARTLLLIWRDQEVKQHTTVSAPHLSFEREKKKVSAIFYPQALLDRIWLFSCFFLPHTRGEDSPEKPHCSLIHLKLRPWASNGCRIPEPFQAVCPSLDICEAAEGLERVQGDFTIWQAEKAILEQNKWLGFN